MVTSLVLSFLVIPYAILVTGFIALLEGSDGTGLIGLSLFWIPTMAHT